MIDETLNPTVLKSTVLKSTVLEPTVLKSTVLEPTVLNPKRIRDNAPYRKSISLTEEDMQRLSYLEKTFASMYPPEVPFSFSKTISKTIELAFQQVLDSRAPPPVQQSLSGTPADPEVLQLRQEQRIQGSGQQLHATQGKPKKFQKGKRRF